MARWALGGLLLLALGAWADGGARVDESAVEIGTVPPNVQRVWVSADGLRLGFDVLRTVGPPSGRGYIIDGVEMPHVGEVGPLLWSPDSAHWAYAFRDGGQWRVCRDGVALRPWPEVSGLTYGPDGRHLAYRATSARSSRIVVDDVSGPGFAWVGDPVLAAGGACAYWARKGPSHLLVFGEARYGPWEEGAAPVLSPDGRHIACAVRRGSEWFVLVDGVTGPPCEGVLGLTFSLDSRRVAYAARSGDRWRVVSDGYEGPPCEDVWDRVWFGKGERRPSYLARIEGRAHLFRDGVEVGDWAEVDNLLVSPDGLQTAFVALQERGALVVVNGKTVGSSGVMGQLAVSADGRRVAWMGVRDAGKVVVVDGEAGEPWGSVGPAIFSRTGAHVAYAAFGGTAEAPVATVVLDGQAGERYDAVFPPSFTDDATLTHLGVRGKTIYRVTQVARH